MDTTSPPKKPSNSAAWHGVVVLLRYALPSALVVVGAALWIFGSVDVQPLGSSLVGAAIVIVVINVLIRLAFASQLDRDREEAARRERAEQLAADARRT